MLLRRFSFVFCSSSRLFYSTATTRLKRPRPGVRYLFSANVSSTTRLHLYQTRASGYATMSSSVPIAFARLPAGFTITQDNTHATFTTPIEQSDSDDRSYRLIRLANDLDVLLVHDPETDKASAAMDVHVGHLSDPHKIPGLAHFCEHLLFMGTEKYPKENDYNEYLSQHSGHSNAFTSAENTNYYFEVGHDHLEGALDRFAQFFICPLFSASCTDRELRAVDSEHKKNLQSDNWRVFQLEKTLSNPNHPYCKFGTGNLKTLRDSPAREGLDIRDELIKFHDRYYSANIMKLVVLGRESLDQLASWAVEKFSGVNNKEIEVPRFEGHPLTQNELLKQTFVKPVKDIRTLELSFPFPDQYPLFRAQPGRYLSHLIGHEGQGSILSLLKKKGWANYLSAGASHGGIGFEFFKVSIDLTEDGLVHYEDVVKIIFQYIDMMKRVGIQEWSFKEVQSLAEISFRFKEKSAASHYTSHVAGDMQRDFPPEWILSGSSLIREYNPSLIEQSLSSLACNNFKLTLVSQNFGDRNLGEKERWYGTEYAIEDINPEFVKSLQNLHVNPELEMPKPNDFIPKNFEIHKKECVTVLTRPHLIKNTPLTKLWHKKDDTFWIPRANVWIMLKSPLAYSTPGNCVKTRLYTDLIKDALNEYSYDADIAGLSYSLENEIEGILLLIDGYNDKMPVLLEKIVDRMKNFSVDRERFVLIKEQLQRSYKNFAHEAPHQHAMYYLSYLTQEKMWTHEEKLAELNDITPEDIQAFFPQVLSQLHIEALVHGNMFKDEAIRMTQFVEDILKPKALIPSQLIGCRSLLLPQGGKLIYQRDVQDENNVNSAIEYYVQVGDITETPTRARLSLLAQITQEPCFDQLRTKEQLGYLVFSGLRKYTGSIGLRFIIQSERDTVHLENRIEEFLEKFKVLLEGMSEEEYKKQVDSLIAKKLEKYKNLWQESSRYWMHINSGYYDFGQVETDVSELRTIKKSDLLDFYTRFVHTSSQSRKKLSVHLRSKNMQPATPTTAANGYDVQRVHACITAQGVTVTVEDLRQAVETANQDDDPLEKEKVLRKFLVDETKVDEATVEALMKSVSEALNMTDDMSSSTMVEAGSRDNAVLPEGNTMITDMVTFKSNMQLSKSATPVVELSDLSVSKL